MKRFIASLPPQAEIAIVLLCAFGWPAVHSLLVATRILDPVAMSDGRLLWTVVIEVTTLALLGAFLRARGWTVERFGLGAPSVEDGIDGAGLLAVAYLVPATILLFMPADLKQGIYGGALAFAPGGLSLALVILMSVVNPIFEEVFVVGYVFAATPASNRLTAINISTALRLVYHLYQGPSSVIFILPLALVFAWWFSTRGRLWSLVLAHAGLDLIGLASHARF